MTAAHQPWTDSPWFATWLRLARHAALLLACVWSASGASYYVATNGSDSNPGTLAQPWLTITYGISQLAGQDTLYLRGGAYTNDWNLGGIPSGASWSAMTTIRNYASETPVIKPQTTNDVFGFNLTGGQYVCIQGVTINLTNTLSTGAGVKITENANHIRLTNCVVTAIASGHGILVTGGTADNADDNQILNCTVSYAGWLWDGGSSDHGVYVSTRRNSILGCDIYGNSSSGGHGIHFFDGNPDQNTVAYCRFWGNDRGVGVYSGLSNLVYNSLSYSNIVGFRIGDGAQSTKVLNCNDWKSVWGFRVEDNVGTNTAVENCIAFQCSDYGIGCENSTGKSISFSNCLSVSNVVNFADSAGTATTNACLFGNSYTVGWTAPASLNFQINASSSAFNAGKSQTAFSDDFIHTHRPQAAAWDIGAYEFIPTTKTRGILRKR